MVSGYEFVFEGSEMMNFEVACLNIFVTYKYVVVEEILLLGIGVSPQAVLLRCSRHCISVH
jgi:hypothetical protein